jgi:HprK-related kinase A
MTVAIRPGTKITPHQTLLDTSLQDIRAALSASGLWFEYGAATLRLHSDSAAQLQIVYGAFDFVAQGSWADLHVKMHRPWNLRRWFAAQVLFRCDGVQVFEPFPADTPLPILEWGSNWLIAHRLNDHLLLHAGVVERNGLALLLPAQPGSGKSTLTAALSLNGWRLLSDEFGVYDPALGAFRALLKPIALKNASIGVIRAFAPHARLGPEFPKTRKGTVAHLGADGLAVVRRHEPAAPGAVILPRWVAGSSTKLEPLLPDRVFPALAFNSFNYTTLGAVGFDAVIHLVRCCPAWTLVYSDLADAMAAIDGLWPQVLAAHEAVSPDSVEAEQPP